MQKCYCSSDELFNNCCEPYILEKEIPQFPEQLMRSRYVAYVLEKADYLLRTTHISERKHYSKEEILAWAKANTWLKLEVINAIAELVEFKAYYLDERLQAQVHHEKSAFKQEKGIWYYVDGVFY